MERESKSGSYTSATTVEPVIERSRKCFAVASPNGFVATKRFTERLQAVVAVSQLRWPATFNELRLLSIWSLCQGLVIKMAVASL